MQLIVEEWWYDRR